ncbi:B-box-type zinc finger [Trypanosoma melophagium]|uniref:B-box-type zinc finger n=1 Tax=Trypanosoma melophagium TaxID=715481 RepID=UPI003519F04D|nr:B-box-type zinc finger [Trypanosoma melophagium]
MLLRLVVYVDDARTPVPLEDACVHVYNMPDLFVFLEKLLKRPPQLISYWNSDREEYEVLTSLTCFLHQAEREIPCEPNSLITTTTTTSTTTNNNNNNNSGMVVSAHLWVETRPLRLDVVDPDVDVAEYTELKSHVQNWAGNAYVMYSLQNALRVSCPRNERLFDHVRYNCLKGDPERVELLFYTNNSLSSHEVLERGFDRVTEGSRFSALLSPAVETSSGNAEQQYGKSNKQHPLFVFSSSMTDKGDKEPFSLEPHKVLLCEVAPGRGWPSSVPLLKNPDAPPSGYDSVCFREERNDGRVVKSIRVGKNHQALPRYVLTIVGKKSDRSKLKIYGVRLGDNNTSSSNPTHMNGSHKPSYASAPSTPYAFGRSRSVGNRTPLQKGSIVSAKSSMRSGSEPPINRQKIQNSLLPSTVTCSVHNGTLLGLWCFNCSHMICPYCAAVGEHKGHEVCNVETVAGDVRRKVQDICHSLSMELDNYQRVKSQLQLERKRLQEKHMDAVNAVEAATADLHSLIDAKKQEWLERMREQSHSLDTPLKEVYRLVQQYKEAIETMEKSYERAGEESYQLADTVHQNSATFTSVVYLMEAPKLLSEGERFASQRHDSNFELAICKAKQIRESESALFHIDFSAVYQSIERLVPTKDGRSSSTTAMMSLSPSGVKYSRLSTTPRRSLGEVSTGHSDTSTALPLVLNHTNGKVNELIPYDLSDEMLDHVRGKVLLRRLSDVRTGYIWCVHNASKYFHPDQRRAVCSGPFRLLGLEWDLRIQAPDTFARSGSSAKRTPPAPQDESVGLFLFPVGHTLRVDYRVSIFSAVSWVEWRVSGWTAAFAGKGWGVYPLLPRRELMQTDRLAGENTLKICVAPTSGVY